MLTRFRAMRTAAAMVRRAAVAVVASALGGCYAQTPLMSMPAPETHVVAQLNDAGRVGMAAQVGPSVTSIEGVLDSVRTDSEFTVHVTFVSFIDGTVARWSGEPVTLRPGYVGTLYERHLSKGRTAVFVGGLTVALGVFAFTRGLGVLGGGGESSTPGGSNSGSNSRWVHP
jgi:hypothetical protein